MKTQGKLHLYRRAEIAEVVKKHLSGCPGVDEICMLWILLENHGGWGWYWLKSDQGSGSHFQKGRLECVLSGHPSEMVLEALTNQTVKSGIHEEQCIFSAGCGKVDQLFTQGIAMVKRVLSLGTSESHHCFLQMQWF